MTADNENEPRGRARFSVEDAKARAQQAFRKSEFILSRAFGLLREPKKEWEQIKAEETTIPSIESRPSVLSSVVGSRAVSSCSLARFAGTRTGTADHTLRSGSPSSDSRVATARAGLES